MGSGIGGAHPFPHIVPPPPPVPLNLEDDQRLSNSTFTVIKKICIVCCVFIAVHILLLPSHKPCFSMLPFKICLRHPSGTSFLTGASLPKKVLDSPPPPERSYVTTFWHRILRSHGREITRALKINDV